MNSKFLKLNILDFLKGLLMAVLVPILIVIQTTFENGQLVLDWKLIVTTSLASGIGYLLKNLLSGKGSPIRMGAPNELDDTGGHPDPKKEEK